MHPGHQWGKRHEGQEHRVVQEDEHRQTGDEWDERGDEGKPDSPHGPRGLRKVKLRRAPERGATRRTIERDLTGTPDIDPGAFPRPLRITDPLRVGWCIPRLDGSDHESGAGAPDVTGRSDVLPVAAHHRAIDAELGRARDLTHAERIGRHRKLERDIRQPIKLDSELSSSTRAHQVLPTADAHGA